MEGRRPGSGVLVALVTLLLGMTVGLSELSAATIQYNLTAEWGKTGSGEGEFLRVAGIDVDAGGNVYTSDGVLGRIQRFSSEGTYLSGWGGLGSANGRFTGLQDVAVDFAGNVYALDLAGNRVQRFSGDGDYVGGWDVIGPTLVLSRSLPFGGIATDGSGDVYVASSAYSGVVVFDGGGNQKRIMNVDTGASLNVPTGIDVNGDGVTYVFDTFNRRIQLYAADGQALAPISGAATPDTVFRSLARGDVDVDAAGRVYVADFANARIHRFAADGTFEHSFVVRDSTGRIVLPGGIAVDSSGNVYVAAYYLNKVLKFSPAA